MKKFLAIILVVILALGVVACKKEGPKKASLTMGTGGESGTYFAVGGVLANVLNEKNPDIIGWIYVGCADISYPVLQAKDNDYYLHRDYRKQYLEYLVRLRQRIEQHLPDRI